MKTFILLSSLIISSHYSYVLKSTSRYRHVIQPTCAFTTKDSISNSNVGQTGGQIPEITGKSITKEIMSFFSGSNSEWKPDYDVNFRKRILSKEVYNQLDGMHILTILFQCARSKRLAKTLIPFQVMIDKLTAWKNVWSERDISTFVYGIRSLEGIDSKEGELLLLGAKKIKESNASLSSRSIGNALYGLQGITSTSTGAPELCEALALKIENFKEDLIGQDIGIGMYGLQGMSSDSPQVRMLINTLAEKIVFSVSELDAQALSNALYGLQSMSSDYKEVLLLVNALASKISESTPTLNSQALGSALYGLQKLSSDKLEVRTLVAVIAEKVASSSEALDAQAIGNSLFGLQRMKTTSAEVRALVQAIAEKLNKTEVELDSKAIGASLYGLHSMSSDVPQVRLLLNALAVKIDRSKTFLSGQGIADALFGLSAMQTDCVELRSLIRALTTKIDSNRGKLDSQEIGNAIFGFQGLSSEMVEVRQLAVKVGEKIRRSTATLRSQHIGRAVLGLQRLSADSVEIRYLIKQLTKRIAASDRTRMTSVDMADALFGLQGMNSKVPEVQELVGELAKKIANTAADFSPVQLGRALFGLQGLSSSASIFQDSVIGLDSDDVTFLLSAIYDKIKQIKDDKIPLSSLAMALQGMTFLRDPISTNIKIFLYNQILKMEDATFLSQSQDLLKEPVSISRVYDPTKRIYRNDALIKKSHEDVIIEPFDIINSYRAIKLNSFDPPPWLEKRYREIELIHGNRPVLPFNRQEKLVLQKYTLLYNDEKLETNLIVDGFRLDFKFANLNLNIELDGPSHKFPSRARFDRQRDEYLKVQKGYDVVRIQMDAKTVEEIVTDIRRIVTERAEQSADLAIQKLYFKEEKIQKLYSRKK